MAVVAVTAVVWRRSASHPHNPARDALILSAIVLSCPRFMYYDILMATPAMLVALSGWKTLAKEARILLSALVLAYFAALPLGFVDIKVCAVDEVWSGLKLVVRKTLR